MALRDQQEALWQAKAVNKLLEISQKKLEQEFPDQVNVFEFGETGKELHYKGSNNYRVKQYKSTHKKQPLQKITHNLQNQQQIPSLFSKNLHEIQYDDDQSSNLQYQYDIPLKKGFSQANNLPKNNKQINSMNSTCYGRMAMKSSKPESEIMQNLRYIRGSDIASVFTNREIKARSNVVHFSSNKSETVRELLNHMKIQKERGGMSGSVGYSVREDNNRGASALFSPHQIKQLKKYKNFLPFREDERLLVQKIGERQSVWKRRFKQSWQKRKKGQQGKCKNLKAII